MKDLEEVNSQFQKVKETIQNLEEVLSQARKLQEQKMTLQASSKYLPIRDIKIIIQKSDAKIEDAKLIHQAIEKLKKKSGYMTENEIQSLSENIRTLKTRFQMGGSMLDEASGMNCNSNDVEDVVDLNEDTDNEDELDDDNEELDGDDDDVDNEYEELNNDKEPGVNFANILQAAFMLSETKSSKETDSLTVFLALLRTAHIKA